MTGRWKGMSSTATVIAATCLIVPLLIAPVVLRRRIRDRIDEQVRRDDAEASMVLPPPAPVERFAGIPPAAPAPPAPVPGAVDPGRALPAPGWAGAVRAPAVPLSQLLAGMTLPCELAPLTNVEPPRDGGDRLVFVTDAPAELVRADLKGALAAVEFDLTWWSGNEGVAAREGAGFRVLVHPAPEVVTVGSRPAFPTAPPGTTVVELATP